MTLWLRVIAGPDRGKRIPLRAGAIVLGAGDVDVPLRDPRVSRSHASFELVADGVRVRDLRSKNGTRVNGAPTAEAVVRPGAVVEIGDTALVVDGDGDVVDVPRTSGARGAGAPAFGASMRRIVAVLDRAARSDVTVLLQGESGTGKDVMARALHGKSSRAKAPFVVVDCGAIAPGLVASELFGHKRGAFTSAHEDRVGAFEAARGGTLFLDEIGELPLELQPALLRVLEMRQVTRVGESHARHVDVRVVAATNRKLKSEVDGGRFRADLFFRLAVVSVALPPLRERKDEILAFAGEFLREQGRSLDDVAAADRRRLLEYPWPGNVRELKNVVLRACALTGLDEPVRLTFDDDAVRGRASVAAPGAAGESARVERGAAAVDARLAPLADGALLERTLPEARRAMLDDLDARYLAAVLEACGGNVSAAARKAGVARSYFHRLLQRHRPSGGRGAGRRGPAR